MENVLGEEEEKMELPPGFRFHPTDEELITHYLSHKVVDGSFAARAIGDVDLNKCEPWDLPWKAKMGEKEWYFFCVRDRKYPTGLRTNRATDAGYWKATGKDKEIHRGKALVGMKKTLVFYRGRAPKGEKTNWVMHEYRLEGKFPKQAKNEWVICRVFQKTAGGKKMQIPSLARFAGSSPAMLPPLTEDSGYSGGAGDASLVTCFSDPPPEEEEERSTDRISSDRSFSKPPATVHSTIYAPANNLPYPDSILFQEQSILRLLYENGNNNCCADITTSAASRREVVLPRSSDGRNEPSTSAGPVDLDCLWNY